MWRERESLKEKISFYSLCSGSAMSLRPIIRDRLMDGDGTGARRAGTFCLGGCFMLSCVIASLFSCNPLMRTQALARECPPCAIPPFVDIGTSRMFGWALNLYLSLSYLLQPNMT